MSRHAIPLKPGIDATEAVAGWDRPLQTFFVQVLRRTEDGEDEILLWEGAEYGEIKTPAAALRLLEPWCDIPDSLSATLQIERMETLAASDGPRQKEARDFLKRLRSSRPDAS